MTPQQAEAARRAGRFAGSMGVPVDACPYDPNGDDDQRALALVWVRARRAALVDPSEGVDFTD